MDLSARDVLGGDGELVTAHQLDGTLGEGLQTDLRTLEVGEDADGAPGVLGDLPDAVVPLLVFCLGPVAEVESGHVHTCLDERFQLLIRVDGGAQRADNFGTAHDWILSVCFVAEYSVWWKVQVTIE